MADDGPASSLIEKVSYEFLCEDGPDAVFRVHRMRLSERFSQPYQLELDLVTKDIDAAVPQLLGASIELIVGRGEHMRSFFGVIAELDYVGRWVDQLLVHVRIVPAFALLQQRVTSRIFQEMSVQDIVNEVLEEAFGDYDRTCDFGSVSRGTDPRDYCVQYRESDLDFVARLLEEEGISYHFMHDVDKGHEVMVMTDDNAQFDDVENLDGSRLVPIIGAQAETAEVESLRHMDFKQALTPTASLRQDYDFLLPMEPLTFPVDGADERGRTRRLYSHMRRRYVQDDVETRAGDQIEAAQVFQEAGRGQSNVTGFSPGRAFELDRHDWPDLEQAYLVTAVIHSGDCPEEMHATSEDAFDGAGGPRYQNRFECVPMSRVLRPRQLTPKPRIHGPQTAIVVGDSGEEIHVDEHGRIKIQLHWEEERKSDDTSSCWVRVSQSWAGPGWGHQFIPRIGMEVVVEFLEGNPDRPLVTGCVYNGDNSYPYPMPDSKTQSGIKTDSSIGDGFNEFRFEDAAGSEEVFLHAQKDWNTVVLNDRSTSVGNDETHSVGNDRTKTVGHDQSETIGNDKTIQVDNDHTETITGNRTQTVQKDAKLTVNQNQTITVTQDRTETIVKNLSTDVGMCKKLNVVLKSDEVVGAMKTVKVGGLYSEQVGASRSITAVGAFSVTAGLTGKFQCAKSITIKAQQDVNISADKTMALASKDATTIAADKDCTIKTDKKGLFEAGDELTLKCGKATVTLKKNGDIVMNGNKVTVKGSGKVTVKGSKIANN